MRILVVDDDPDIRTALRRAFALEGYESLLAADATQALRMLRSGVPDLVVLDGMLPDVDGLDVCRRIRAAGESVPVLMLTARDALVDRVAGLDAGADDYLAKPFDLEELLARVRALVRRASGSATQAADHPTPAAQERISVGDLVLRPAAFEARRGDRELQLTRTEYRLLEMLARNAGAVCTRVVLIDEVWGDDDATTDANLEMYVSYLRRKLEEGGEPRMIRTVRGIGYTIRAAAG